MVSFSESKKILLPRISPESKYKSFQLPKSGVVIAASDFKLIKKLCVSLVDFSMNLFNISVISLFSSHLQAKGYKMHRLDFLCVKQLLQDVLQSMNL